MNPSALEEDAARFATLAVQFDQAKKLDEAVFYYKVNQIYEHLVNI